MSYYSNKHVISHCNNGYADVVSIKVYLSLTINNTNVPHIKTLSKMSLINVDTNLIEHL